LAPTPMVAGGKYLVSASCRAHNATNGQAVTFQPSCLYIVLLQPPKMMTDSQEGIAEGRLLFVIPTGPLNRQWLRMEGSHKHDQAEETKQA